MKPLHLAPVGLAIAAGCVGAAISSQDIKLPPPTPDQTKASQVTQRRMNAFTFRLLGQVLDDPDKTNVCVSPLSISLCLSALLNGTAGRSFDDLRKTISYDGLPLEEINNGTYATLTDLINVKGNPFTVANSLWLRTAYPAKPEFQKNLTQFYGADFYGVKQFDSSVLQQINDWTKEKTKDRIEKILDDLDPNTSLVLVNALTFDGTWKTPFEPSRTSRGKFTLGGNKTVDADLMNGSFKAPYVSQDGVKALRLPYAEGNFSMVLVLPKANETPQAFLKSLNDQRFKKLLENLDFHTGSVDITMPKFTIRDSYELRDPLSKLGMASLFGSADLSNLADFGTDKDRQVVSKVVHKTYIEVDEKGTKAAASTAVVAETTAAPSEPKVFKADRPFAYFVVHDETGVILFAGACDDPTK